MILILFLAITPTSQAQEPRTKKLVLKEALTQLQKSDGTVEKLGICSSAEKSTGRMVIACGRRKNHGQSDDYNSYGYIIELQDGVPVRAAMGRHISSESKPFILSNGHVIFVTFNTETYTSEIVHLDGDLQEDLRFDMVGADSPELIRVSVDTENGLAELAYVTNRIVNDQYPEPNQLIFLNALGQIVKRVDVPGSQLSDSVYANGKMVMIGVGGVLSVFDAFTQTVESVQLGSSLYWATPTMTSQNGQLTVLAANMEGDVFSYRFATGEVKKIFSMKESIVGPYGFKDAPLVMTNGNIALMAKRPTEDFRSHLIITFITPEGHLLNQVKIWSFSEMTSPLSVIATGTENEAVWIGAAGALYVLGTEGSLLNIQETVDEENFSIPVFDRSTGDVWVGSTLGLRNYRLNAPMINVDADHYQRLR